MLLEMDERIVKYLKDKTDDVGLPFDHIFGNDLRKHIPILAHDRIRTIIDTVKHLKGFKSIDWDTEEVIRTISLDPKYGGGEKDQRIGLGRVISNSTLDNNQKKDLLNWIAKHKGNIKESMGESQYSIILSRAPIDVLRMSDFDGITSCHTKGKDFFKCAIQEAITGGAVAYIVKNDDIKDLLKNGELQSDDFFYDPDRNVGTVTPKARLRIRKLRSDYSGEEAAVPDKKVYGDSNIPGFYDTLKSFIRSNQTTTIQDIRGNSWKTRGGTYYDVDWPIEKLISSFYDTDEHVGYQEHEPEDSSDESYRMDELSPLLLTEECDEITEEYNRGMQYSKVECYITTSDTDPYGMGFATITIPFPSPELQKRNKSITLTNLNDIKYGLSGDYDEDGITWSNLLKHLTSGRVPYVIPIDRWAKLTEFEVNDGYAKLLIQMKDLFYESETYEEFCKNVSAYDNDIYRRKSKPSEELVIDNYEDDFILAPLNKQPLQEFKHFYQNFTVK